MPVPSSRRTIRIAFLCLLTAGLLGYAACGNTYGVAMRRRRPPLRDGRRCGPSNGRLRG